MLLTRDSGCGAVEEEDEDGAETEDATAADVDALLLTASSGKLSG